MQTTILDQIHAAKNNPIAALFGALIGAAVPLSVFDLAHNQVATQPLYWLIIAPALLYSALTVYSWGMRLFEAEDGSNKNFARAKSFGLVALLEASMTFAHGKLPYAMLVILALINAIELAYAMVAKQETRRATEAANKRQARKAQRLEKAFTEKSTEPKVRRSRKALAVEQAIKDTAPLILPVGYNTYGHEPQTAM